MHEAFDLIPSTTKDRKIIKNSLNAPDEIPKCKWTTIKYHYTPT
jgi:hypothetical protein